MSNTVLINCDHQDTYIYIYIKLRVYRTYTLEYKCIGVIRVIHAFSGPLHNERALRLFTQPLFQGANPRKHRSSASLAFVWEIHRSPMNSPQKGPVTRKMFPFDDVIMQWMNHITVSTYDQSTIFLQSEDRLRACARSYGDIGWYVNTASHVIMKKSWQGSAFELTGPLSLVDSQQKWQESQSFGGYIFVDLDTHLNKQSGGLWNETLWRSCYPNDSSQAA